MVVWPFGRVDVVPPTVMAEPGWSVWVPMMRPGTMGGFVFGEGGAVMDGFRAVGLGFTTGSEFVIGLGFGESVVGISVITWPGSALLEGCNVITGGGALVVGSGRIGSVGR